MPRIRLRVEERELVSPCAYREPREPAASPVPLPVLRLTAVAVVGAPPGTSRPGRMETALIDTGSWLSVVELGTWRKFEMLGLLEHLPFSDGRPQTTYLVGHAVEYRLGRLWITLADAAPTQLATLPSVPVVAQLLESPTPLLGTYPLILGLHRGVLDGRKLTREVVPHQPAPLATDRGRFYGQEWFLESA